MVFKAFRALKWLIVLAFLLGGLVVYLAVTGGGDSFRWAGQKSEETGKTLRDRLERTAEKADQIEEAADQAADRLKEIKDKIP